MYSLLFVPVLSLLTSTQLLQPTVTPHNLKTPSGFELKVQPLGPQPELKVEQLPKQPRLEVRPLPPQPTLKVEP